MDVATSTAADDSTGCGCGCGSTEVAASTAVQLPIVWQRLVDREGETCPRCASTQAAVEHAVASLTEALRPLGIEPTLETRELDQATFDAAPVESNRIWIAGKPLEAWIDAETGSSRCCSVCGDRHCRTLDADGTTFESIPERLIVKAGLAAAASLALT